MIKKKTLKKLGFKKDDYDGVYRLGIITRSDTNKVVISFSTRFDKGLLTLFNNGEWSVRRSLNIETKKDLKQLLKLLNV